MNIKFRNFPNIVHFSPQSTSTTYVYCFLVHSVLLGTLQGVNSKMTLLEYRVSFFFFFGDTVFPRKCKSYIQANMVINLSNY